MLWAILGLVLGVLALLLLILLFCSYKKAPPDTAYFITGFRKKRVLIGRAGMKIPFFERLDKVPLNIMQVDIKTSSPVPTNEFINIHIDGVANVKISNDRAMLERAAEIFLAENIGGITKIVKEVLDGNMREIIGQMKIVDLVHNRDEFAQRVQESAHEDMAKMGLEILNLTIQNFTDDGGVLVNLGIDKVSVIKKDAEIARAVSERDVEIAKSRASEEANRARIEAQTKIIEQNTSLALKEAEMKIKADTQKANADASYEIQKQIRLADINISGVNAEIAKREKEVLLGNKEVELKERKLDAEIKKKADAEKYAAETLAQAELFKRQKASEALKYEQEQQAAVQKIRAEARKFEAEKEAEAEIKRAEAQRSAREQEAVGILAVGKAEADAIEKKAEAMKKMGEASVLELVLNSNVLPNVVGAMTSPLASAFGKVDSITMYGEGNSARLTEDITKSQVQLFKAIEDSTGLDMKTVFAGLGGLLGGKMLADSANKKSDAKPAAASVSAPAKPSGK
ncbi:MAG: flotillin family protein [Clostridiales bacterium]|jgi:flotillin|nr:flotillin family protein [Clostridiales bacterium]